jgi:hypothetical protein
MSAALQAGPEGGSLSFGPCAGPRLPCALSLSLFPTKGESLSSVALSLAGDRGRGRGRGLTGLGLSRLAPSHTVSWQLHTSGKPPISCLLSIGGLGALLNPALVLLWSGLVFLSSLLFPPTTVPPLPPPIWPGPPLNGRQGDRPERNDGRSGDGPHDEYCIVVWCGVVRCGAYLCYMTVQSVPAYLLLFAAAEDICCAKPPSPQTAPLLLLLLLLLLLRTLTLSTPKPTTTRTLSPSSLSPSVDHNPSPILRSTHLATRT